METASKQSLTRKHHSTHAAEARCRDCERNPRRQSQKPEAESIAGNEAYARLISPEKPDGISGERESLAAGAVLRPAGRARHPSERRRRRPARRELQVHQGALQQPSQARQDGFQLGDPHPEQSHRPVQRRNRRGAHPKPPGAWQRDWRHRRDPSDPRLRCGVSELLLCSKQGRDSK